MIVAYVCAAGAVHHVYSVRMLKKSTEAIAVFGVVDIGFSVRVFYVGYRTWWSGKLFDKSTTYEKIQAAVIVLLHVAVELARFVKKLDFFRITVDSSVI